MPALTCPHCNFSKELPADRLPQEPSRVTCPQCRQPFTYDPAAQARPSTAAGLAAQATMTCPHCNMQRQVPREKIPPRLLKVRCPKCGKEFPFDGNQFRSDVVLQRPQLHPSLAPSAPSTAPQRHNLAPIGELFSRTWQMFKRRVWTLIGINLLAIVLFVACAFVLGLGFGSLQGMLGDSPLIFIPVILVLAVFGTVAISAFGGAMTFAVVDESVGVREALGQGLQRWASFFWVFSLVGYILLGGYFAFFIPGLLFTVWFIFAQYILAAEGITGMDALLASRAYVRGHGWGVLGRLLLLGVVGTLLGMIPFVGILFSLLLGPFSLIWYHEIYRDLRAIKSPVSYDCSNGTKAKYLVAGSVGYLVIPVVLLLIFGPALYRQFDLFRDQVHLGSAPEEILRPQALPTLPRPAPAVTEVSGPNRLTPDRDQYAPGETIVLHFSDIEQPALKDRIGLFQIEADNQSFGEARYLAQKTQGDLHFTAPQLPGVYEFRLFLNWPAGGSEPVAKSRPIGIGMAPPASAANETGDTPEGNSPERIVVPAVGDSPGELMLYVYAINYTGSIRLNGTEVYPIAGERDMNYNYTGGVTLQPGNNRFDLDYRALPDPWMTELKLKLYRYDWQSGTEQVLGEWVFKDAQGPRVIEVELGGR